MRFEFEFRGFGGMRPREHIRFALYAIAAKLAGHAVHYVGETVSEAAYLLRSWGVPFGGSKPDTVVWCGSTAAAIPNAKSDQRPRIILAIGGQRRPWFSDLKLGRRAAAGGGLFLATCPNERAAELCPDIACVPHTIGPNIVELFARAVEPLRHYLTDDLAAIRAAYCPAIPPVGAKPGFVGANEYGRSERAGMLGPAADAQFSRMSAREYVRFMATHAATLDFPGQIPATYRFTESVVFGRPVVRCKTDPEYVLDPPLDHTNHIALRSWGDREGLAIGLEASIDIVAAADACYLSGWSIKSQIERAVKHVGG